MNTKLCRSILLISGTMWPLTAPFSRIPSLSLSTLLPSPPPSPPWLVSPVTVATDEAEDRVCVLCSSPWWSNDRTFRIFSSSFASKQKGKWVCVCSFLLLPCIFCETVRTSATLVTWWCWSGLWAIFFSLWRLWWRLLGVLTLRKLFRDKIPLSTSLSITLQVGFAKVIKADFLVNDNHLFPSLGAVEDLVWCYSKVREDFGDSSGIHATVRSNITLTTPVHIHFTHWDQHN